MSSLSLKNNCLEMELPSTSQQFPSTSQQFPSPLILQEPLDQYDDAYLRSWLDQEDIEYFPTLPMKN